MLKGFIWLAILNNRSMFLVNFGLSVTFFIGVRLSRVFYINISSTRWEFFESLAFSFRTMCESQRVFDSTRSSQCTRLVERSRSSTQQSTDRDRMTKITFFLLWFTKAVNNKSLWSLSICALAYWVTCTSPRRTRQKAPQNWNSSHSRSSTHPLLTACVFIKS